GMAEAILVIPFPAAQVICWTQWVSVEVQKLQYTAHVGVFPMSLGQIHMGHVKICLCFPGFLVRSTLFLDRPVPLLKGLLGLLISSEREVRRTSTPAQEDGYDPCRKTCNDRIAPAPTPEPFYLSHRPRLNRLTFEKSPHIIRELPRRIVPPCRRLGHGL